MREVKEFGSSCIHSTLELNLWYRHSQAINDLSQLTDGECECCPDVEALRGC